MIIGLNQILGLDGEQSTTSLSQHYGLIQDHDQLRPGGLSGTAVLLGSPRKQPQPATCDLFIRSGFDHIRTAF